MAEDLGLIVTRAVAEGFKAFGQVKGEQERVKSKAADAEAKKLEGEEKEKAKLEAQRQQDEDDALAEVNLYKQLGGDPGSLISTHLENVRSGLPIKPFGEPILKNFRAQEQQRAEEEAQAQQEEEAAQQPQLFGESTGERGLNLPQGLEQFGGIDFSELAGQLGLSGEAAFETAGLAAESGKTLNPAFQQMAEEARSGFLSPEDIDEPGEQRSFVERFKEQEKERQVSETLFGGKLAGLKEKAKQEVLGKDVKGLTPFQQIRREERSIIEEANLWWLKNVSKDDREEVLKDGIIDDATDLQIAATTIDQPAGPTTIFGIEVPGTGGGNIVPSLKEEKKPEFRAFLERYRSLFNSQDSIGGFGSDGSLQSEEELEEARELGLE